MSRLLRTTAALALVALAAPVAHAQTATFNFESVAANTPTPIAVTNNGLTATFTGSGTAVCDVSSLGFTNLSGRALIQNFCLPGTTSTVVATFSNVLTQLRFGIASPGSGTIALQAFLGSTLVSSLAILLDTPPGGSFREAVFTTPSIPSFDRVVLDPRGSVLALDNITATVVPEPGSAVLLASGLVGLAALARRRRTTA